MTSSLASIPTCCPLLLNLQILVEFLTLRNSPCQMTKAHMHTPLCPKNAWTSLPRLHRDMVHGVGSVICHGGAYVRPNKHSLILKGKFVISTRWNSGNSIRVPRPISSQSHMTLNLFWRALFSLPTPPNESTKTPQKPKPWLNSGLVQKGRAHRKLPCSCNLGRKGDEVKWS